MLRDPAGPRAPRTWHGVGTVAKIARAVQAGEETAHVLVLGLQRFTVREPRNAEGLRPA